MKRFLICFMIMIFFYSTSIQSALSKTIVAGQVFLPETNRIIITTRDNHRTKKYTGFDQDTINAIYDSMDTLIAFIIYPEGPYCLLSDEIMDEMSISDFNSNYDFYYDYYSDLDDYMLEAGYLTSETELVDINGYSFVVNYLTGEESRARRGYITFYTDQDMNIHTLTFDFHDYKDLKIWNDYIDNYMSMISFKPGMITFSHENDIRL